MVEVQKWNPEIQKTDYPYQVAGKYFGAKSDGESRKIWDNLTKNNQDWLAKMAGVVKYDKTVAKQNTDIADRLRINHVESFYNYKDNAAKIDNFDEMMKVNASKNLLDQQTMEYYISNLNDEQLKALNTLPPTQRLFFIAEECKNIENVQGEIQQKTIKFGGNIENKNLAVMKELDGVIERTNNFLRKIGQEDRVMGIDGIFKGTQAEEEYAIYKKQITETDEYKKMLKEKKDEQNIDRALRNGFRLKKIVDSEVYTSLGEKEKSEFGVLVVDYYMVTQKLNINIESLDLGVLYDRAREIMALEYGNQEKEPAHTLMNTINADDQIIEFFSKEENKIDALSPEGSGSEKLESKAYYTKAFSFYPDDNGIEGGTKPIKEYLEYFNDDMTIKNDISDNEKQEAEKALGYIKERYTSHEKVLVEKTNMIVQEYAMSQCIETLQKYMDIDIDEKENLLNTLEIMKGTDVTSSADGELVLNIEGERRNGKKISLSYDLISGNVYACPFLYKASVKDSDPLVMGNQTEHYGTPLVTLASIRTILDGTQETNFKDIITESVDSDAYEDAIKGAMDKKMIFGVSKEYDITQDTLKKCILKGDIVQDIMLCTGKAWPAGTEIANEGTYQSMYEFYQYIYRSLEYYSMKSPNQLTLFKENIEKMLKYRNADQTKSVEDVLAYKDDNQEMFALQALVNPSIMPFTASKLNDQGPEENMSGFFKCFKKKIGGLEIIDVQMMDDCFTATEGTNKVENKVGTWERNADFESLVGNMETDLTKGQATADMYKQFDEQNIT